MRHFKIFPEIEIIEGVVQNTESTGITHNYKIKIQTTLRLPDAQKSKWYLTDVVVKSESAEENKDNCRQEAIKRFIHECYMMQVCGKINESITNSFGEPLFDLDKESESEEDRMKRPFTRIR